MAAEMARDSLKMPGNQRPKSIFEIDFENKDAIPKGLGKFRLGTT
jgi:hypothetical protein